jgi:hypothetical protein
MSCLQRVNHYDGLVALPTDVIFEIARLLTYSEMIRLCQTCRTLYQLFIIDDFGHIWQVLYRRHISAHRVPPEVTSSTQRQIYQDFNPMMAKTRFLEAAKRGYDILVRDYLDRLSLHDQGFTLSEALKNAARSGYHDILEWLVSLNPRRMYLVIEGAAAAGNMELVDRFLPQVSTRDLGPAIYEAAKGGHLDIMNLLIWLNPNRVSMIVTGAAHGNQRDLVEDYLDTRPEYLNDALFGAATGGHLELVHDLLHRGANIDSALNGAARGNQIELARWLLERGARTKVSAAAQYGSLEVMSLLLEQDDPSYWDDLGQALESAASRGHWEVVTRLLLEMPPNRHRAIDSARHHGYHELATFIQEYNPRMGAFIPQLGQTFSKVLID